MADVRINHETDSVDVFLDDNQKIAGVGPNPYEDAPVGTHVPKHYLMESVESRDGLKKTWECACGYSLQVDADRVLVTFEQHITPAPRRVEPAKPVPDDKPRFERHTFSKAYKYEFVKGNEIVTIITNADAGTDWLGIKGGTQGDWIFTPSKLASGVYDFDRATEAVSYSMKYCYSITALYKIQGITKEEQEYLSEEERKRKRREASETLKDKMDRMARERRYRY